MLQICMPCIMAWRSLYVSMSMQLAHFTLVLHHVSETRSTNEPMSDVLMQHINGDSNYDQAPCSHHNTFL